MKKMILPISVLVFSQLFLMDVYAEGADGKRLASVLERQPQDTKARYPYRHPQETLTFFGIAPGMSVVEVLPGRVGWYSKILMSYLGKNGALIGADYSLDMYPKFSFATPEMLEEKKTWTTTWTDEAKTWRDHDGAQVSAFVLGSMPDKLKGTADAVLFIRALHNLNRFEVDGGFLTDALKDAHDVLRPGGMLGVVQHQAPDNMADAWADGSKGYLKKGYLITSIEQAGFDYVAESDINANDKDRPGEQDVVWRLPPSFATSRDNPELKATYTVIGESNRMTLKFRKPE